MADNTNNPEIVAKIKFDTSDAPETIGNLRQEFAAARKEIYETTKGTDAYFIALKKAADVKAELTEMNRIIRLLNPEEKLKAIQGLAEGAVGAFTAVRAASKLFGDQSEAVTESIEKLEASLALLKGLKAFNEGIRDARALIGVMGIASKAAKANAAATKEIGVAQEANAVGTETATTATKGFGLALKGIGIGLIISALAYLITNFDDISASVKKIFPNLGSLGEMFDKVKEIAFGVGNVILQYIVAPFKAVVKLFQGDFKGALQAVKDGANIVGNFEKGSAYERGRIAEEHRKEEIKKEIEHTENLIEVMDARGQDTYKIEKENIAKKLSLEEEGSKEFLKIEQEQAVFEAKHLKEQDDEARKAAEKAEEERKKHLEKMMELQKEYNAFIEKADKEIEEQKAISGIESAAVAKYKREIVDIAANQKEEQEKLKTFLTQKLISQAEYNNRLDEINTAARLKNENAVKTQQKELIKEAEEKASKEVEIIKHSQTEQEAAISESFAKGQINKDQYEKKLFDVNTLYLNKEKETLTKYGQDTANINKLIAENDIKITENKEKAKAAIIAKANKELLDKFKIAREITLKDDKKSFAERLAALNQAERAALASTTITNEQRIQIEAEGATARKEIDKLEADVKKANFKAAEGLLNSAGEAIGKNTAAGKAAAIAATTISTYQGASLAYTSQLIPGDPTSPARGFIAAAASIAAGLARVKAIVATKTPGGSVGSESNPVFTAPASGDFSAPSIQQSTPTTSLSQDSINQISNATQQNQPSQISVSESDISSVQARVSQYTSAGQI